MEQTDGTNKSPYTCNDYRIEMILLSLQRRLHQPGISDAEKKRLEAEIEKVKAEMDM